MNQFSLPFSGCGNLGRVLQSHGACLCCVDRIYTRCQSQMDAHQNGNVGKSVLRPDCLNDCPGWIRQQTYPVSVLFISGPFWSHAHRLWHPGVRIRQIPHIPSVLFPYVFGYYLDRNCPWTHILASPSLLHGYVFQITQMVRDVRLTFVWFAIQAPVSISSC